MKSIIPFIFLLCCISASCQKENFSTDNRLSIGVLQYSDSISKLPLPASAYLLRIELMKNPYSHDDLFASYLFSDTVYNSDPVIFTPDSPMPKDNSFSFLSFGRYIIYAQKGKQTAISELLYKGGDIQLNLILK